LATGPATSLTWPSGFPHHEQDRVTGGAGEELGGATMPGSTPPPRQGKRPASRNMPRCTPGARSAARSCRAEGCASTLRSSRPSSSPAPPPPPARSPARHRASPARRPAPLPVTRRGSGRTRRQRGRRTERGQRQQQRSGCARCVNMRAACRRWTHAAGTGLHPMVVMDQPRGSVVAPPPAILEKTRSVPAGKLERT